MLTVAVGTDQTDWDSQLPYLAVAYRTMDPTMGFRQNFLVFGHKVTLPVDVIYSLPPGVTDVQEGGYPQASELPSAPSMRSWDESTRRHIFTRWCMCEDTRWERRAVYSLEPLPPPLRQ